MNEALLRGPSPFSEAERELIATYVSGLNRCGYCNGVHAATAVFAAGWDETALYHTVAVTALFNFMNRLVEGLGIALSQPYVEEASKRLAERGYLPLIAMLGR